MVLISRGAMRAFHALMILVCISESSLAQTTLVTVTEVTMVTSTSMEDESVITTAGSTMAEPTTAATTMTAPIKTTAAIITLSPPNRPAPQSVVNLTEVEISPNSSYIQVRWDQPCCNVTGYEINCSSGYPLSNPVSPVEDGSENIGTCINITAGDDITVTVTSIIATDDNDTVRGDGVPVVVTAYPNIVEDLGVLSRTSSSVSVQWEMPKGTFEEYNISCSGNATASPTSVPRDAVSLNATCSNVPAGGEVTVTVSTTSGEKENPESIRVEALPGKVVDLKESSATNDSVTVNWTLPSDDVDGTYRYEADSLEDNVVCTVGPSNTSAVCTNVTPGRLITVIVTTVNGNLNNSATTHAQAYPLAVSSFTEGDLTARNVSFSWEEAGGVVDQYNISCSHGNAIPDVVFGDDTPLESTCGGLVGGETVTVTITTVTGDKTSSATFDSTARPNRVENLREETVETDYIEAVWEKPGGIVTEYQISCEDGGEAYPQSVMEDGSGQYNAFCQNLTTPGANYSITVTPFSSNVFGENATIPITAKPAPPELLSDSSTVDSVSVSFSPSNGQVDYYSVECGNGEPEESTIRDGGDLTATCNVTTPGATCEISVTAVSNRKNSETPTRNVTALPETVTLTEGNPTVGTVQASWSNPEGIVDSFNVTCSPEDIATVDKPTIMFSPSETTYIGQCNVSKPGEEYSMTVTSISSGERSETAEVKLRALPESVALQKGDSTVNSVQASWSMPSGIVDRFEVNCSPGENATAVNPSIKANNSERNYVAECIVTRPGDLYTIEVISNSSGKTSEPVSEDLRALPNNVESLTTSVDAESVTVTWDKPAGVVDSYDTSILDDGVVKGYEQVSGTNVSFDDLTPGTNYTIAVCSRSGDQTCMDNTTAKIRTLPTRPSKPRDVEASSPGVDNVTVSFLNSDEPNGYIARYVIEYRGTKEGNSNHSANVTVDALDSDEEGVNVRYSVLVNNLRAGHFYVFWVVAYNRNFESERSDPANETTCQIEPVISGIAPVLDSSSGRRDIEITINPDIFRPCNGEILIYTVLVDGEQYIANQTLTSVPDYSNCGNSSERKRRNADDGGDITLTIGDKSNSGDGYSNDKLKTSTNYSIAIRVVNAVGHDDSQPTYIVTGPVHPAAYVVPIVIILLISLLVGYIVWKERKDPGSIRKNVRKKFYRNGGVDNPGFITDKPMRRTGNSRPVKLPGFALHLEEMSRDSDYLFSEEYNDLRPVGKNQADDAAKLDCNKVKNRFSNILPYDHTRVKLMPNEDEPGSDFINANYMIGHKSNREYIACQGPLQNTEEDMWRMVWEQGASLIVMVTQLMEGNKIKCHQYWPQDGEGPVRYGDIVVLARGTEHNELWVKRLFTLTKGPATREVVHYNFTAWPDHGVPDSPDHLIKFVKAVRESKKYDGKPVVVHCSAGVGRTGTFISLDTLMSQMESSDEVDIFGLVRRMRMNRCLMVQTEIQYIYIHQCVMALLEGTTENTYENYNGNEDPYYNEALI